MGEFRDIAHPISQDSRDLVQTAVLAAYEQALAEAAAGENAKADAVEAN